MPKIYQHKYVKWYLKEINILEIFKIYIYNLPSLKLSGSITADEKGEKNLVSQIKQWENEKYERSFKRYGRWKGDSIRRNEREAVCNEIMAVNFPEKKNI